VISESPAPGVGRSHEKPRGMVVDRSPCSSTSWSHRHGCWSRLSGSSRAEAPCRIRPVRCFHSPTEVLHQSTHAVADTEGIGNAGDPGGGIRRAVPTSAIEELPPPEDDSPGQFCVVLQRWCCSPFTSGNTFRIPHPWANQLRNTASRSRGWTMAWMRLDSGCSEDCEAFRHYDRCGGQALSNSP